MKKARLEEQCLRDAKNHVYGLAHNVCNNKEEQAELLGVLQGIEKESILNGATGEQLIRNLLCPILDGLLWRNWPWDIRRFKEAKNAKDDGKATQA
jgi:hypothetical protein